jgi:uncharacterized protein (DUF2132 family)
MAFIVRKLEFSNFENWPAIQSSLLPINKQDASRKKFNGTVLWQFNKSSEYK